MSLSTAWTNKTPASTARKNKMTVISDTGTNLTALDKAKHRVVFCTADGGEFVKDHTYTANADADEWIDITEIAAHTHYDETDGGSLFDIWEVNSDVFQLDLLKPIDWVKAQWVQTVTGTGTVEDGEDSSGVNYIRLRPNGTSGSGSTINYPTPLNAYWGREVKLISNVLIETASSLALHIGVDADDITAADSNTRKAQAEVCTATNSNWWLRTASGSANSASDTGIAISANAVAINIVHYPTLGTPRADLLIDTGTVLQKTTNIPTSSATAADNLIKHSIKNSTAADRPLRVYASRLQYKVSDNWV